MPNYTPHTDTCYTTGAMRRWWCVLLIVMLGTVCHSIVAQEDSENSEVEPIPYERDEFPEFLHTLRRFEIIAVGAFPLTYLTTFIVFDFAQFIDKSIQEGRLSEQFAPLFFAPPTKPPPNRDQTETLILTAVGVSLVVAVIDLVIQENKKQEAREQQAQRESSAVTPIVTESQNTDSQSSEQPSIEPPNTEQPSTEPQTVAPQSIDTQ